MRDDRADALRLMRGCTQPAALAQQETVLQHNGRGKSYEQAFRRFAEGGPIGTSEKPSKAPRTLPRQAPAEPMPEREPAAPADASGDASASQRESVEAPAECSKCHAEPRAHVTKRTKPGTESWGSKCRAREPSKAPRPAPKRAVNSPRIPDGSKRSAPKRPAPSPPPKPAASIGLDEALSIVERNAALIARLGGTVAASELADAVEAHGGPRRGDRRPSSRARGRAGEGLTDAAPQL